MPELAERVVFEVDHPDSQRDKRGRAARLRQTAREIRFVPVDFARDGLDAALSGSGHAPDQPTTWVWEGVVMYLEPEDIEATMRVIARRSAPASRLIILYHSPSWLLRFVGFMTRRLGEPLRSELRPEAMRGLLARHGFLVTRDDDMRTLGAALGPEVQRMTRYVTHMRNVVADRL
jgi:methyltransferase (TIGR00027 family)